MKYQYWQGNRNLWCWHLTSDGQVLAQGEGYADKPELLRAIEASKRSRPGDGDVPHARRYRMSFVALLPVAFAGVCVWGAIANVGPRWDGSHVTVDADVVQIVTHGTGRRRSEYLTVRFDTIEGRSVTATMKDSTADPGTTTVRVRYPPSDPRKAMLDSNATPYVIAVTFLVLAGGLLAAAYRASLYDGQSLFKMRP